jgi:uncharacterized damage-inducible protein DinB
MIAKKVTILYLFSNVRETLIRNTKNISQSDLDYKMKEGMNTIGGLLRHIAFLDYYYYIIVSEKRGLSNIENQFWDGSITGKMDTNKFINLPLLGYYDLLITVRQKTLNYLEKIDESWFEEESILQNRWTNFQCLYHVFEDEMMHIGQINMILADKIRNNLRPH